MRGNRVLIASLLGLLDTAEAVRYRSPPSGNHYLGFSSRSYSSSSRQEARAGSGRRPSVCFMRDGSDGTRDATVNIQHRESNYTSRKKNHPERRFNKVPDDRFSLFLSSPSVKTPAVKVRIFPVRKNRRQNKQSAFLSVRLLRRLA